MVVDFGVITETLTNNHKTGYNSTTYTENVVKIRVSNKVHEEIQLLLDGIIQIEDERKSKINTDVRYSWMKSMKKIMTYRIDRKGKP